MVLDKKTVLYDRDDKGKLLPIEVPVVINNLDDEDVEEYKDETIVMLPMTRGKIKKIFNVEIPDDKEEAKKQEKDIDGDIISEYCVNPKITKEETEFLKPAFVSVLVDTILFYSGLKVGNSKRKAIKDKEDEFSKNSEELNQNEKKGI